MLWFFFVSTVWIFIQQVTENRSVHTTAYWFEERGDENNTVRLASVSVHDIYSSAFYLALCFFVSIPSSFPSSEHHSASLWERRWWWWRQWVGGRNLIAFTNEVSWDRQPTLGRMFHGDSEKGGKRAEAIVWNPGGTFMLHNCSLPLGCNARRIPRSPFHVTRQRESCSFIDEVILWVRFERLRQNYWSNNDLPGNTLKVQWCK